MIPKNYKWWSSMIRTTAKGAMITMGSTTVALVGAIYVERTAHRIQYYFFPHWYSNVKYAAGLEDHELLAVRRAAAAPSSTEYLNDRRIIRKDDDNDENIRETTLFLQQEQRRFFIKNNNIIDQANTSDDNRHNRKLTNERNLESYIIDQAMNL